MPMNQEVKAKWLAALRSGQYKQGPGYLRRNDQFCCLGVLCDLFAKEGHGDWQEQPALAHDQFFRFNARAGGGSMFGLPGAVQEWAGFEEGGSIRVNVPEKRDGAYIEALNDGADYVGLRSFSEIAAVIEEQL